MPSSLASPQICNRFGWRRPLTIYDSDLSGAGNAIRITKGERAPRDIVASLSGHLIIFELAAEHVVTRHLSLPRKARDFIDGIILHQIDRLSPWPLAQAIYTIDVRSHSNDADLLEVAVLIASRARIEEYYKTLALAGLAPHRVAARLDGDPSGNLKTLWTPSSHATRQRRYTAAHMIGAGLASMVLLSVGTSVWAVYSASEILSERDIKAEQGASLAKQNQSSNEWKDLEGLNALQKAWAYKERTAPSVVLLETLTHALPDSAYLTEMRLENGTLRLIGLASNAPSLIAPLEKSDHFSDVHFFAPSTKAPTESLYKFFVETHVRKQLAESGG